MGKIILKRIYETPSVDDGHRVLVDRLWPRGVSKEQAQLDAWAKDVAPTPEIRQAFHHDPNLMEIFKGQYLAELGENEGASDFVKMVRSELDTGNVTLLYAAKDEQNNHAVILKGWLEEQFSE